MDLRGQAITKGEIAKLLRLQKKFGEAYSIMVDELTLYRSLGDVRGWAVAKSEIARIKKDLGLIDEAIKIWREDVLPVHTEIGDVHERAMVFGLIADALFSKKNYDEAIAIMKNDALPICKKSGDVRALIVGYTNLAIYLNGRSGRKDRLEVESLLRHAYTMAARINIPERHEIFSLYEKFSKNH